MQDRTSPKLVVSNASKKVQEGKCTCFGNSFLCSLNSLEHFGYIFVFPILFKYKLRLLYILFLLALSKIYFFATDLNELAEIDKNCVNIWSADLETTRNFDANFEMPKSKTITEIFVS